MFLRLDLLFCLVTPFVSLLVLSHKSRLPIAAHGLA